jgi:hypothetical protein
MVRKDLRLPRRKSAEENQNSFDFLEVEGSEALLVCTFGSIAYFLPSLAFQVSTEEAKK